MDGDKDESSRFIVAEYVYQVSLPISCNKDLLVNVRWRFTTRICVGKDHT